MNTHTHTHTHTLNPPPCDQTTGDHLQMGEVNEKGGGEEEKTIHQP